MLIPSQNIIHPLPENVSTDDLPDFSGYESYSTIPAELDALENCMVTIDGVIYKNYHLLHKSLVNKNEASYYQYKYLVKNLLSFSRTELNKDTKYLLITDSYSHGHFHWFCEVLPRLAALPLSQHKEYILLLPDRFYIRTMGLYTLKRLGWIFKEILFLSEKKLYKVPRLYWINNVSKGGLNPVLLQTVRDKLLNKECKGNRALYISRQKAAFRKILNEDELIPLFKKYNIEIVVAEDLSPSQQADLFSNSSVLIGIHGSGLTNCIYMQSGSKVIELRKKENNTSNVGYWHLATSLNHNYYYYNGTPDSEQPLVGRGCNLIIDINDFEKRVLKGIF